LTLRKRKALNVAIIVQVKKAKYSKQKYYRKALVNKEQTILLMAYKLLGAIKYKTKKPMEHAVHIP
jgi:predicted transcriptional regulator